MLKKPGIPLKKGMSFTFYGHAKRRSIMESAKISKALLKRLPLYLNHLKSLPGEDCNVSATSIAGALGLGQVQVRKDLAKISGEGRRRTGRSRDQLIRDIEQYLDITSGTTSIIVSSGALGQGLLDCGGFADWGLNIVACFDLNPSVKQSASGKPIYSIRRLESFCRYYDVHIGIIAVPEEHAQAVCDNLVACGIQAIWNFTQVYLNVPEGVIVHSENLALSAAALRLQIRASEEAE